MSADPTPLADAYGAALVELGERDPRIVVFDTGSAGRTRTALFGERFPERFFDVGAMAPTMVAVAAGMSDGGRPVFASLVASALAGAGYVALREGVCPPRASVKLVGVHGGRTTTAGVASPPAIEDVGVLRAVPGMSVVVPADAPTARAATFALAERPGPAYLRLREGDLPVVGNGSFALGQAPELHAGSDLTIVALGALVVRALNLATELDRVGVGARVLDLASVKPFDEPAILRAARDTGAVLVLEEHSVLTGVGALVAATTAENYPVPVRRVGLPDVFGTPGPSESFLDRHGLSRERLLDEAWELLKNRGKVA
ncbi:MAG: transketolase family protein [Thermoplasmata archaeon]